MTVRRWTQTTTCQKPWCTEEPRHSTSEAASPDGLAGQVGPPLVSGNVAAKQFPTLTTTFPLWILSLHNGLPRGTPPLCLNVKPKCLCQENIWPCPPVDGFKKEEINTSPPRGWSFQGCVGEQGGDLKPGHLDKPGSATCYRGTSCESGRWSGECPPAGGCNEKRMLALLPHCGKTFAEKMKKVEVWKWCNLSEFIVYYESFTNCTEVETNMVGCYWPNPLAESFIAGVHRRFFRNCSVHGQHWQDPPDGILILLIAVPTLLTLAMTGVVVWHSKRADRLV
ncbi:receptor activity-modifying protein 3 isoform X2 [Physeter macrocephalus]|uniref:Receptor activity-modifying protein 3 n=1 Tax=Physeter macrocephalus TaxID=9755 RepID=A0A9W2WP85_PHYMC|nr:receptor activity-modifying protein 3 isoform X2 [Physeter catodon]